MNAPSEAISSSLEEFRKLILTCGRSGQLLDGIAAAALFRDTRAKESNEPSPLVLRLSCEDEVRRALEHARNAKVAVHPISSGHNWGYGTARPAQDSTQVIFDLSAMKKILQFDQRLGIVTIEPGVSQGLLATYLAEQNAEFMVPTTGAGPQCSLIGNALERGYGMTPIADHFQAVLGLSAICADGSIYRSPLTSSTVKSKDSSTPVYRWGVGPYLDGLFGQNGGAIVTQMSLQLMPRPKSVEMFVFWIDSDEELESVVEAIRSLLGAAGLAIGGINLMNAARVSAMAGKDVSGGAAWIGTGVVYGDPSITKAGRRVISRALSPHSRRLVFVNSQRLRVLEYLATLPGLGNRIISTVSSLRSAFSMLSGYPGEFALALAYRLNHAALPEKNRDPARDGCGLFWYAPIVPMLGEKARIYSDMVLRICAKHGFDAPVTFSTLSVSAFDSTVPLIFTPDSEGTARAFRCLRALIEEGRALGFHPYRFHSALMAEATTGADDFWRLADRVRSAIDPTGLIAPGRYERNASAADYS